LRNKECEDNSSHFKSQLRLISGKALFSRTSYLKWIFAFVFSRSLLFFFFFYKRGDEKARDS